MDFLLNLAFAVFLLVGSALGTILLLEMIENYRRNR